MLSLVLLVVWDVLFITTSTKFIYKILLYYFHERLWSSFAWGLPKDSGPAAAPPSGLRAATDNAHGGSMTE